MHCETVPRSHVKLLLIEWLSSPQIMPIIYSWTTCGPTGKKNIELPRAHLYSGYGIAGSKRLATIYREQQFLDHGQFIPLDDEKLRLIDILKLALHVALLQPVHPRTSHSTSISHRIC